MSAVEGIKQFFRITLPICDTYEVPKHNFIIPKIRVPGVSDEYVAGIRNYNRLR